MGGEKASLVYITFGQVWFVKVRFGYIGLVMLDKIRLG